MTDAPDTTPVIDPGLSQALPPSGPLPPWPGDPESVDLAAADPLFNVAVTLYRAGPDSPEARAELLRCQVGALCRVTAGLVGHIANLSELVQRSAALNLAERLSALEGSHTL